MFKEALHGIVWAHRHRSEALRVPEFEWIRPLLSPDDVAFDVGAHGGSWSRRALARYRAGMYAFEALPYYARALKWTRLLRRWDNVTILNQAVVDRPRIVNIVWKDAAGHSLTGTTHVKGAGESAGSTVNVQGVTLDQVQAEVPGGRVRFVKCDVEGFELSVLRGSVKLIERSRPLFWCELWAEYTRRYDYSPSDVFRFFSDRDYRTYVASGDRLTVTDAASYPGQGDILAAPAEIDVPGALG
jgi:FkbM family methyltransferase